MTSYQMIPPSDGSMNRVTVNGRIYSSTPGVAIPVPDFDARILEANDWVILQGIPSINATNVVDTFGIPSPYVFNANIQAPSSSSAIVPAVTGAAYYTPSAAPMTGTGHIIGMLGRFFNDNPTK